MSSNNTKRRAKFINAKPVYFPPMEHKWSNDDYDNGSYKTSVFNDKDGSVSGVPNSYIVIKGGIDIDEACEIKRTWNAAVCKGDIGRMTIGGGGGPVGFSFGRRGAGPAPAGAAGPLPDAVLAGPARGLFCFVQAMSQVRRACSFQRGSLVADDLLQARGVPRVERFV